jgi:hypothetical protein
MDPESTRLMAVKQALVSTTNTTGWRYITQISDNVIKAAERAAIDEEDDVRGAVLRRQAQALRKGLTDLFAAIEAAKQINLEPDSNDWFAELSLEQEIGR